MNTPEKKEERSEYVGIYITPSIKREFELAKDNKSLQEDIIKRFLQSEREWLSDEIKQIDESTVKYSAKLIGIKENFEKAQNSYVEEIEKIWKVAECTFSKVDTISKNLQSELNASSNRIASLSKQVSAIDFHKLNQLMDTVTKFNNMASSELELLAKLLNTK